MNVMFITTSDKSFFRVYVFNFETGKQERNSIYRGDPRLSINLMKNIIGEVRPGTLFIDKLGLGSNYVTTLLRWHKKLLDEDIEKENELKAQTDELIDVN